MNAIEKRAREPNPNVAVIHEAMQHFPEGSWMRGALDHAAAELAVLHGRCQRTALTPPEGYVLVQRTPLMDMLDEGWDAMDQEGNGDFFMPEDLAPAWAAMLAWCERNPGSEP